MNQGTRIFITSVVISGAVLLSNGLRHWSTENLARFLAFAALAILCSSFKVRIPGVTGTFSANFVFVLIGIAELALGETLAIGSLAAIAQTLWRAKQKPKLIQVLFNLATLDISISIAYSISHLLVTRLHYPSLAVLLPLAAFLYFVVNTVLVAMVLARVEEKPFLGVWQQWHLWSFPYYAAGAALAGIIVAATTTVEWRAALLVLPPMYLVYRYCRLLIDRQQRA